MVKYFLDLIPRYQFTSFQILLALSKIMYTKTLTLVTITKEFVMKSTAICLIFIMSILVSLTATNRYVPDDYLTIQSALNVCVGGDTVFVAPGIYTENITWPQVDSLSLISTGSMTNTIIDANRNGRGIGFVCSWQNPVITLATKVNGFTIRNGYGNLTGAGITCYYASPEISNCIIAHNECTQNGSGGGLYCYNASPHLTNVIIAHNIAYSGGGAHIDPLSSPIFNNCVVADNTLFSPGGSYAAGIYGRYEVYFQLNNCTVTRNRYLNTSAIHLGEVCTPTIQHSTITDNLNGILVVHNGGLNLQQSNITNNSNNGIWHSDSDGDVLNTQNNWWGSTTGPYHETSNPLGTGDTILGNANYSNWLQSPDPDSPPTPPSLLQISDATDNSITIDWLSNPEPDIDHYIINYGLDSLAVIHPNSFTSTVTSYTLSDLTAGTLYSIQIAAVNNSNKVSWYSTQVITQTTGVNANEDIVMPSASFVSNYPNPFTGNTKIRYELKRPGQASMAIYNVKGELVKQIFNGRQVSGTSEVTWNGIDKNHRPVAAGIYFARLVQNGKASRIKLVYMK